jgi:hypothetical protein
MKQFFSKELLVSLLAIGLLTALFFCSEAARSQTGSAAGEDGTEADPPDTPPNHLPVIPRVQEGCYTCWATCAEMVMEFLGAGRIRQCEQAGAAFSNPTCCGGEGVLRLGLCDSQWYPEFKKWGFDFRLRSRRPLSWGELTTEINEGRPVVFSWVENPPANINHMMVLIGYHESGGERTVTYLDPSYDTEAVARIASFSRYDGSSREHPHRDDYHRIGPLISP